jgi:hypothetical protein
MGGKKWNLVWRYGMNISADLLFEMLKDKRK